MATCIETCLAKDLDGVAKKIPEPLTAADFHPLQPEKARLGQLLFYDPVLSGNRNISCGTCHHHSMFSTDQLSLGVGEGGTGLGKKRNAGYGSSRIERRVPRNSPALFNLGAKEISSLFHDGRVSIDNLYGNGFNTPAEEYLPSDLDSVLAAQALFPLTAETEMSGNPEENEVAGAAYDRLDKVWPILVRRLQGIQSYLPSFQRAFADISNPSDITISHVANALAAFISAEWQSYDSKFDSYLAGDESALTASQLRGMELFYGKARCSECHSGKLLTDHQFHALALPPIGPGRTRQFDPLARDLGRMGETDDLQDAYRFKTPALRNVALTGPYGHNGAFKTLEGIIRHHLNPLKSLDKWQESEPILVSAPWLSRTDFITMQDRLEMRRYRSRVDIQPVELGDREVQQLVSFLESLTGLESIHGRLGRPEAVPSGLEVDKLQ